MKAGYKIRTFLVLFLFSIAYALIVYTVYTITIVQQEFFLNLGLQQYKCTLTTLPDRGKIYDRYGTPLAINKEGLAAFITPTRIESPKTLEKFLSVHFPGAVTRWQTNPTAHFMYIARRLTAEQIELIGSSGVKDIYFLHEPQRLYPIACTMPVVGAVDVDNHGIAGIEMLCDDTLRGEAAVVSLDRDARSGHYYFAHELKKQGTPGQSIYLTIDADLQFLVTEEVKAHVQEVGGHEGAALVVDPATGDIHAVVSYTASDQDAVQEFQKVIAFTDAYELGSVMKTFVALALLQEKLVEIDELVDCKNSKMAYVQGVKISTWKEHDLITLKEIIQYSNNIGIAQLALRLGPLLYDHYKKLGFGSKTSIVWPGQQIGFVNPPENWSRASIISLSFGYELRASLLQLAQALNIVALNGVYKGIRIFANQEVSQEKRMYDAEVIENLKAMLEKTVEHGTAYRARLRGYRVMGKTGTANMVIDGKYNTLHNVYTFAGIVEKDEYQRVIIVFVKDVNRSDVYASKIAAPLFERIAQKVLIHDKVVKKI